MSSPLRITAVQIRDFKAIHEVDLEPGSHTLCVLEGANGAGKSSVLDAITYAIGGPKALRDLDEPVRRGAEQAEITLRLASTDEVLTVRRRVNASGRKTLEIRSDDGRKYASPQSMLDRIVGEAFIDPMAFFAAKEREQRDMLLRAVPGLGDDLDRIEAERKEIFDQRTGVNRSLRDARGELASLPEPGQPVEPVDVADLHRRKAEAERAEADHQRRSEHLEREQQRAERLRSDIERLQAELQSVQSDVETLRAEVTSYQPVNTWALEEQLSQAEERNRAAEEHRINTQQRTAAGQRVERLSAESEQLTEQLTALDDRKQAALAAVEMPLPDLTIDDEGRPRLRGSLLTQISDSERLRLSVAVAASLRKDLRAVWIANGERLDNNGWSALATYARENDLQIIIERVGVGRSDAIVIEEGRVAGAVAE